MSLCLFRWVFNPTVVFIIRLKTLLLSKAEPSTLSNLKKQNLHLHLWKSNSLHRTFVKQTITENKQRSTENVHTHMLKLWSIMSVHHQMLTCKHRSTEHVHNQMFKQTNKHDDCIDTRFSLQYVSSDPADWTCFAPPKLPMWLRANKLHNQFQ